MNILVINPSGMVGHVVSMYMQEHGHKVIGYDSVKTKDIETINGDIYNTKLIEEIISDSNYDAVINCSAIINQNADADKPGAVFVNSYLPHFLEKICENTNTVVVHRSTDCIFSGLRGNYTLTDMPDAKSFYARTKAIGEIINDKDITIRTSLIGPEYDRDGTGLFNWFYNQDTEINGYANAIWTGLTTIEFAREIKVLLNMQAHGVFQLVPNYAISKYDLLVLFDKAFKTDKKINRIDNQKIDKSLIQEINGYELHIPDYEAMIREMSEWISEHKTLYTNY